MRAAGMFALLVLTLLHKAMAQDAHFSQYYAASLYLNPAMAGVERELTFSSSYRAQWRSIVVPYVTNQVSMIVPVFGKGSMEKHLGGIGLSVFNDKAGDGNLKTTGANITFAYNLIGSSETHELTFAVQGGLIQRNIDFNKLEWGEQFNPYIGFDPTVTPVDLALLNNRKVMADLNAGLMWTFNADKDYLRTGKSAFSGIAVSHMNRPNESMVDGMTSRLPILFKYHGGIEFHTSSKFNISPNLLVMAQNHVYQVNAGTYVSYKMFDSPVGVLANTDVIFGAWYRLKDAFIFNTGIGNEHYTLGFSYDLNSSMLRYDTRGRGAFEISLSVRNAKEHKRKRFSTPRI
jgi:type IX secretion system PorP/SprF family membrane protein